MAKTLRSRIAAVAVVALGAGLIQAVPASATVASSATPFGVTNAQASPAVAGNGTDTVTATQVAGANNYVTVGFDNSSVTYSGSINATNSAFLTVSGGTFSTANSANVTFNTDATTATLSSATATTGVNVLTPATGTITVKFIARSWSSGVATDTTKQTITISVIAAAVGTTYDHSKLGTLSNLGTNTYKDINGTVFAPKGTAGSAAKATDFTVTQYSDADENTTVANASTLAVTASISGVGLIKNGAGATTTYIALAAGSNNGATFEIYNDGRAGVGTVTITVGGNVVGTKTVTFYGSAASYSASVDNAYITPSGTGTVTVTAKDSNGTLVPNATIYGFTSSSSVAGVSSSATTATSATSAFGKATFTVTGASTGAVTLTFGNNSDKTLATVTTTAAVNVSGSTVGSVTISFDKATYAPGEKATITVTAKDANGAAFGDGAATLFAAAASSTQSLQGSLPGTSVTLANGVATYTVYMPLAGGPVTVSATTASAAPLATAAQAVKVSATAKVVEDTTAIDAVKADLAKTQASLTSLAATIAGIQTAITALVASTTATLTTLQAAINKIMKKLGLKK